MFKIKQDFNDVVRENTGFVTSIVKKFVKNPEIIKDLTQEIFIRAYQSYPINWGCTVYYNEKEDTSWKSANIKKSESAPNLYEAKTLNYFGSNVKSALYVALPEKATNIRMIRGNGVLDCGKYKFLYVDRYVTADEGIFAECTFNM